MKLIRGDEVFEVKKASILQEPEIRKNLYGCLVDEEQKVVFTTDKVWAKVRELGFKVYE